MSGTTLLRPWQARNLAAALAAAANGGGRTLWCAPTGCGKTRAQLAILDALRAAGRAPAMTTPSGEIARSLLERTGAIAAGEELTEDALWKRAEAAGVYSPVRLRNRLRTGKVSGVGCLVVDEGHHVTLASEVWAAILAACPGVPVLGWTATPYRGSHRETAALRAWWGEPEVLATIVEAEAAGYVSIPTPEVWPLLDDAGARVAAGGEYDEEDVARLSREQGALARLAERIGDAGWIRESREEDLVHRSWDRPTLVAVASVALAHEAAAVLSAAGLPAATVSGETPRAERDRLLGRCRAREVALVQVQVLAEGVDLPWLRRLVDLRPLRSPVAWMQLLGRITRPVAAGESAPEYVAGCRNAERHGYLLSGQWPARKLAQETQAVFPGEPRSGGGPLERGVVRDALRGRQVVRVPLLGGGAADVVHLGRQVAWDRQEEVLVVGVPGEEAPRTFVRDVAGGNGERVWGRWRVGPLEAAGYAGWTRPAPAKALSEKMGAWWGRAAAAKGLDPAAKISRQEFPVLPALSDTGTTLLPAREAIPARAAAVASTSGPEPVELSPEVLAEVERQAAAVSTALAALEAGGPLPATWAKLRDGGWGARVAGEAAVAAMPGRAVVLRTKPDAHGRVREVERMVARVVARGEGWALCEVAEPPPSSGAAEGRYAVEDRAGKLRFLVVGRRSVYEQAGPELHPARDGRLADLLARIATDPAAALTRYGRELGICGRCGLALTDLESRARGLGPVCARRIGS